MSFDPMAAAVAWFDAYRAGDIETILAMYAEDAVVHCSCEGIKIITSTDSLRAYWDDRLRKRPASHLEQPAAIRGWNSNLVCHTRGCRERLINFRCIRADRVTYLRSFKLKYISDVEPATTERRPDRQAPPVDVFLQRPELPEPKFEDRLRQGEPDQRRR